jgi:hypothetical protein
MFVADCTAAGLFYARYGAVEGGVERVSVGTFLDNQR